LKKAQEDYLKIYKTGFKYQLVWDVVKGHDKWLQQSIIGEAIDKAIPKRRRAADPAPNPSGSNEGSFNPGLPNLNEDSIPKPRSRRKGKYDDSSSKGSLGESVKSYTDKKAQFLLQKEELVRAKYAEQMSLISQQKERLNEKQERDDIKFFTDSHEHITNPRMLKVVLDKKKKIAEKYGWEFDD
jgi:hypothetical protein